MRERPILFSAPMVRALLDGRKTQTRRVVKPQPECVQNFGRGATPLKLVAPPPEIPHARSMAPIPCPYGVPGDVLWVRESFSGAYAFRDEPPRQWGFPIWHWADGNPTDGDWTRPKPSIHMPRWASRLTLRITDVRVERLNDCSTEDAKAEGWDGSDLPLGWYANLWETINGPGSWAANPWVWAVSFEAIR